MYSTCTHLCSGEIDILTEQIEPDPLLIAVLLLVTALARLHDLHQQIQVVFLQRVADTGHSHNLLEGELHEALVGGRPRLVAGLEDDLAVVHGQGERLLDTALEGLAVDHVLKGAVLTVLHVLHLQ